MTPHRAALLAWTVAGITLLFLAGSLLLTLLTRAFALPPEFPADYAWSHRAIGILSVAGIPLVGGLIAARRPGNPYGWIWLTIGLGFGAQDFAQSYSLYALLAGPGRLPFAGLAALLASYSLFVGISMLPFALLLFPTGRLPSPRWRPVAWAAAISAVVLLALAWATPGEVEFVPIENPLGLEGLGGQIAEVLTDIAILLLFLTIALGAVSLLLRFRRAVGEERQQMKWFAFAALVWVAGMVQQLIPGWSLPGVWDTVEEAALFSFLIVAIGIAILKYRLYDIDVIIRRTLIYAVVTAMLAAIYVAGVVLLQGLFRTVAGRGDQLAVIGSTLGIAALFNPLRGRVQEFIDRRFYRHRYDAEQVLAAFSATLREEVDLDRLTEALLAVVEETMQPEHVSLWLREPGNRLKVES